MAEESKGVPATGAMEEYAVSEACIACDACCNDFPEIFKMDADHTRAIPFATAPRGKFNPWDIIYDCPVDAITLAKGELPPPPADKKPASAAKKEEALPPAAGEVVDTRPWEVRWAEVQARGLQESAWERMKRYGTASTLEENQTQYLIRLALPETVPEHPLKYRWNLPNRMPDYKLDIRLDRDGRLLLLKGWLEDPRVKKLCGIANSFPDRFLREVDLPWPCKDLKQNYNPQEKILDIILDKA